MSKKTVEVVAADTPTQDQPTQTTPTEASSEAPVEAPTEAPLEAFITEMCEVQSKVGGIFINPFTNEQIGPGPSVVVMDSWLQSQIEAGKIEKV